MPAHWVALLAPKSWSHFLSYLTAWLPTLAWQGAAVDTAYSFATLLQCMIVLVHPSDKPLAYQTVSLSWGATSFAVAINSVTTRFLARFEGPVLVLHLAGFFCILIPMVYLAPHNDAEEVFTTFLNLGGWSTQALSFFVGAPSITLGLLGADVAVHMSEEIRDAAVVVPRTMIYSVLINSTLAFSLIIGVIFCLSDIEAALAARTTMFYPFLEVFRNSVKSIPVVVAMVSVILVNIICSSAGIYASASRILWSFARDKGLPFNRQLAKLTKNMLPVPAVITTLSITMLLTLVGLGSSVALRNLVSITVSALYASYLIVCVFLLWRRCTGAIRPPSVKAQPDALLIWGPWRMPEPLGTINNTIACAYISFIMFCALVFGVVVIFAVLWYIVRARHNFKGPIREI
ncbi:putative amino acid permease [Thozetella sp. PMI_491]|nr:putative amino acid permease [Thozetella sp. PMI_491]